MARAISPFEVIGADEEENDTMIIEDEKLALPHPTGIGEDITIENCDSRTTFRAGQLQNYHSRWRMLGAPPYILKIISGYRIPFKMKPPLCQPHQQNQTIFSPEMSTIITEMLSKGVIIEAKRTASFISSIFLRPKSDGTMRPIFNLKKLNVYVHADKFRLINTHRVPDFLQAQDWMAKIDLHQAYFHLPIARSHQRYLRLLFNGKLYQMTCLPFGLNSAPKAFATLTNWIAQLMRERGIRVLVYLDDFILAHQNRYTLQTHVAIAVDLLVSLGWKINKDKSVLAPQKSIEFLGVVWDTWKNVKYLPQRLKLKLNNLILDALQSQSLSLDQLQKIIGTLNFASFVVLRGRLNYRALQVHANALLKAPPRTKTQLGPQAISELLWWQTNFETPSVIHNPLPSHYLTTDASDIGWGAKLDNKSLQGTWTASEKALHCNQKELIAIIKVLREHGHYLSSKALLIQCDNKTAVSYLRNEGGTKSRALGDLTREALALLDRYRIHMTIYHLPGNYNSDADHLSRYKAPPEWHLLPRVTKTIFLKWGTPEIDLFASHRAHVVPIYCSLDRSDPRAKFHDALGMDWDFSLAWVFPPPYLIPKVLAHLNKAKGIYMIVAPRWEKVYWRPDLKNRAIGPPFTIRRLPNVLIDTSTGLPPTKASEMILEVWRCGGGNQA